MKKIILPLVIGLLLSSPLQSQIKFNISLANWGFDTVGIWKFDVVCTVQASQVWRVGSDNIRIDFVTIPALKLTVHPDNSTNGGVRGANSNLNNNVNYDWMTTTSINGGTAISLNIVLKSGGTTFHLNPGTYTLGRIRFNRVDSCCTTDTIRHSGAGVSVFYDSLTLLTNAQWSVTNPPPCTIVGVGKLGNEIPTVYKLYDNYPNPFNPTTTIKFDVPRNSLVKLIIYDILGKEVVTLVNDKREAGRYEIKWDAASLASGTYFLKMETDAYNEIKKMMAQIETLMKEKEQLLILVGRNAVEIELLKTRDAPVRHEVPIKEGIQKINKQLVEVLREWREITGIELIEALKIDPRKKDAGRNLWKDFEVLIGQGLVEQTENGWKWLGK